MRVALTGATGFIGHYIARHFADQGHQLRCWHRHSSKREGFDHISDLEWIASDLGDPASANGLVDGCDADVHAALYRPGMGFRGAESDPIEFVQKNVVGTL